MLPVCWKGSVSRWKKYSKASTPPLPPTDPAVPVNPIGLPFCVDDHQAGAMSCWLGSSGSCSRASKTERYGGLKSSIGSRREALRVVPVVDHLPPLGVGVVQERPAEELERRPQASTNSGSPSPSVSLTSRSLKSSRLKTEPRGPMPSTRMA